MSIEPRLLERRQVVAEDRARHSVRRLLRVLIVLTVLGAGVWLMLSPFLSVKHVTVKGVRTSETSNILLRNEVIPGTPMILIRAGEVETDLQADPWIIDATVRLEWPGRVEVSVEERTPAAWVRTDTGWSRRAIDGVAVPSARRPDGTLGWARLGSVTEDDAASSPIVLGAIEFIEMLPGDLTTDVVVRVEDGGELWAVVSGYQVRLGRPVQMREKALSLAALLEVSPPRGAVLTLVAPTHPAVTPIGGLPDSEGRAGPPQDGRGVENVDPGESAG